MKVLINRRPRTGPWGGGALFVNACYEHLPKMGFSFVDSLSERPDIILMVDPHPELPGQGIGINEIAGYKRHMQHRVAVVHRINECDARKGTTGVDNLLMRCSPFIDERVFVSNWLKDHLISSWSEGDPARREYLERPMNFGNSVIINGVDKGIFCPNPSDWSETVGIITHHWSDNHMKGTDVSEWIDQYLIPKYGSDRFTYTFIGRIKADLKNTRVVPPKFGRDLGLELSCANVYVSGSRFDPGPNHILEGLACGLRVLVHKDGGGAVEFAGADSAYSSFDELEEKLCVLPKHKMPLNENAVKLTSWEECVKQYAELFDELTSHIQ